MSWVWNMLATCPPTCPPTMAPKGPPKEPIAEPIAIAPIPIILSFLFGEDLLSLEV